MDISQRIKIYRKYLGLTQEMLAAKAGINEKYYGRIERGESCPTVDYVIKLCDAMEINMVELFLIEEDKGERKFRRNPRVTNAIIDGLRYDIDIHFNRNVIFDGCESSIWYNGFVGSMNFDEFELRIYAVGNVKGQLYLDYEEILELNSEDVSNELKKYIRNDRQLKELIEFMPFDQEILDEKGGNAFFVSETNWFTARLINNNTGETICDDIILDTDNIMEGLRSKELFFDYIFSDKYASTPEFQVPNRIVEYAKRRGM